MSNYIADLEHEGRIRALKNEIWKLLRQISNLTGDERQDEIENGLRDVLLEIMARVEEIKACRERLVELEKESR